MTYYYSSRKTTVVWIDYIVMTTILHTWSVMRQNVIIIRFFSLSLSFHWSRLSTWSANNCLRIIVYSCAQRCKVVLLRIMYVLIMRSCVHFCEKWLLSRFHSCRRAVWHVYYTKIAARMQIRQRRQVEFTVVCLTCLCIIFSRRNKLLTWEGISTSVITSAR